MAATVKSSKKRVRALSSSAKATLRLLTSGWRMVVMYNTAPHRGSDSYFLVREQVRKGRKPQTIARPVNYQTFRLFNARGLVVHHKAMKNTRGKIIGREFIAG